MTKVVIYNPNRPPFAAFLLSHLLKADYDFIPDQKEEFYLAQHSDGFCGNLTIAARIIEEQKAEAKYLGNTPTKRYEISGWVEFATSGLSSGDWNTFDFCIQKLDWILMNRTYLTSPELTFADLAVYEALKNQKLYFLFRSKFGNKVMNVTRFFNFLDHNKKYSNILGTFRSALKAKESSKNMFAYLTLHKRFPAVLPEAVMGEVVTRFPPEASGYIHIGHAKAAWINYYFAKKYNGSMVFRFDDTNPEKEKVEFEKAILDDMAKLGIEIDHSKITHTSNYFELFLEYAEKLIKEGKAYCDDTEKEEYTRQKYEGIESVNRNNSVEKNLEMWEEMKKGSEHGCLTCLRAKMDMTDPNKCCRDPVMYRVKIGTPHPRLGNKYKVYPTYDFACPIVDSIEGVTHACRTSEYNDRNKQFYNFIDMLGIRKPIIYDYSRLNFTHTVMSKRKLRQLVAEGVVDGWTDPRMPTVRALLRRGITLSAMEEFILSQGASRRVATFEWSKLYALNKKKIDPVVPRYSGFPCTGMVRVDIDGIIEGGREITVQVHPQNKQLGTRKIKVTPSIYLMKEDTLFVKDGEEVTLRHIGNIIFTHIERDDQGHPKSMKAKLNPEGDVSKTEWKFTWLPCDVPLANLQFVYYDPLLTKPLLADGDNFMDFVNKGSKRIYDAVGEIEIEKVKKGEIVQIERVGYFIIDIEQELKEGQRIIMIHIPENVRKKKTAEKIKKK